MLCFSSATEYHAGGKDADAPMAGGTDKFKYDTRAKVAEQGGYVGGVCM